LATSSPSGTPTPGELSTRHKTVLDAAVSGQLDERNAFLDAS
jgi:hypothetical protein